MEKALRSFLLTILLLLLHYVMPSSAMIIRTNVSTDQLTLLSLKSQISSDTFHYLDESWSPATYVCHWIGVTCDYRNQRVKSLNLSDMTLTSRIPREFGNLTFLVSLNLGSNNFHGNLPQEMNSLSGDLPNGLCNDLPILKELYLSGSKLDGHMPTSLSNCSRLQILSLSGSNFDGPIHNEIGRLSNLQKLYLGYNHFTGIIPEEIGNLVNLVDLSVERNQITGSIPINIFNISSLQVVSLGINNLKGSLPQDIGNLTKMQFLYLTENRFTGVITKEIRYLVELQKLALGFNSFSGSLPMEIFNISRLRKMALSFNNLSGTLPSNIGSTLPNIEELYLSDLTNLVGTIPHSISNCSKLTNLELSDNKLSGLIPNSLGYLTHLHFLNLQGNNLTSDSFLSFLTSLTNCRRLTTLSLSFNPLNGMLPVSVGNFSKSLVKFYATASKINGQIPNEVGNLSSLLDLDLSHNNLIGSIPTSTHNLRNLQRSLPNCLGNVTSLRLIYLASNIPTSLGNLKDLIMLDLSSNNMVGSLPPEIRNLKAANQIDLSMNHFSYGIPREIGGLQNLVNLSLTHNKLQGSIPDSISNMIGIALVFVSIAFLFLWIRYRRGKRAPQQADSLSIATTERISYYELLQATDSLSESNLIGSGSFGSVYKGVLRSGMAILVKVFNLQLEAAFKSFDTECEVLLSLRHRNLVKVITSCSNLDFKALVLEYMPNGSLDKYLYSHNYFLDIRQRLSIMIYVACALEYFHHGCSLPVIHCDIKPSNVLLDEDMVAHLSDFGISKLLGEDEIDLYTKTLATFGYIAPGTLNALSIRTFDWIDDIRLATQSHPEMLTIKHDIEHQTATSAQRVTCDYRHQRVKSLNLSDMALSGRIPRDFGNLTFLVSLDLGRNNFHGNLPQEMVRLRRLKFLKLSFNKFRGEIPSWFGFLERLQVLNLQNNSFTGFIPPSLSNASRLETLEISANLLEGNIPEEIGNLHNLNWLSIEHNQLTGSIPFTIFNISRIKFIAFTDNSLSGNLPNGLCNRLPILKGLHLSMNKLDGHMPKSLSNCSQLQILSLSQNEFDGPIHSEIGRLSNLQTLLLGSNHFTGMFYLSSFWTRVWSSKLT
nr:LRR-RLK-4 [Solanum microdontum subsp. gigantophyllum]